MAWIELHDTLPDHPKTIATATAAGIDKDALIGKLCRLWTWSINHRENGFIADAEMETVAEIMRWTKKPKVLFDALSVAPIGYTTGFLEHVEGGHQIHDWDERVGMLRASREKQRDQVRERVTRYRNKEKVLHETGKQGESNDDVTQCNALHERYVTQNVTVCNDDVTHDVTQCNAGTVPKPYHTNNSVRANERNRVHAREDDLGDEVNLDDPRSQVDVACGYNGIRLSSDRDDARIDKMLYEHPIAWVLEAIRRTGNKTEDKRHLGYVEGILRDWKAHGKIDDETNERAQGPPSNHLPSDRATLKELAKMGVSY